MILQSNANLIITNYVNGEFQMNEINVERQGFSIILRQGMIKQVDSMVGRKLDWNREG